MESVCLWAEEGGGGECRCLKVKLKLGGRLFYIMKERPQAEATASMMRARLLLTMCLAMSLDAERIVEVRNCNNNGRTGSTTSGFTTPATYPTLSHTASRASIARSDGSHVRTCECVNKRVGMMWMQ